MNPEKKSVCSVDFFFCDNSLLLCAAMTNEHVCASCAQMCFSNRKMGVGEEDKRQKGKVLKQYE